LSAVTVTLLYFAWVREAIGFGEERVTLPCDVMTPGALCGWLAARGGDYGEAFGKPERLRCAVDQAMAAMDAPLGNAREIAFFPPVTGG
jgi:sulfur-carrier protein